MICHLSLKISPAFLFGHFGLSRSLFCRAEEPTHLGYRHTVEPAFIQSTEILSDHKSLPNTSTCLLYAHKCLKVMYSEHTASLRLCDESATSLPSLLSLNFCPNTPSFYVELLCMVLTFKWRYSLLVPQSKQFFPFLFIHFAWILALCCSAPLTHSFASSCKLCLLKRQSCTYGVCVCVSKRV